ncbi:MAG: N-6 DNA methylase [Planctomycetota bacterium]|nr:N-6 DNA methylase [Planctomycetota bacterium]
MTPLEAYLQEVYATRSTGASVPETSYYPALANLLNAIGAGLKPKVHCVINLQNRGAGIPDGGLFTPDQFQTTSGQPSTGQMPSRGALEVKPPADDAWLVAEGAQVSRYWGRYRQVLVTNLRDFVLVGEGSDGKQAKLETYRLADNEEDFWQSAAHVKTATKRHAVPFEEFLRRVLLHAAGLADPKDVAWFLASYARTAKARIEHSQLPALSMVRQALEESLGMKFQGERGEHFFRSTLVQTLFYGVFSAWVLWCKKNVGKPKARFNWHEAAWSLRVPMIRALFEQVASPAKLEPLGLVEVLDWTAAALNRVDRAQFFAKFEEDHAVQYFYEPFLEAFDPELRKELGVWYTPHEVVQYMVGRVDAVLREELDIPDGLADKRVFVVDPCCGTGAYLVEVLRRIAETLKDKGGDALAGQDLKRAAMERVFGFEILPAPFVVAHLQLGLLLQQLNAPLSEKQSERVGVYLTNALTGWEPPKQPKTRLLFPEMEEERDAADKVKRETPILVILGNPPYNGFAGVAVEEERELTTAYRTAKRVAGPQGQGLNDLYVRFFRMAERRIVEMNKPAKGVVCFISNYSWLDGLSFTAMRERYLESFDKVWVDCLNGDKYKTGKLTPEGQPDPSVFSTEYNREGIQVGTAIALMVRKDKHAGHGQVQFRHFWGKTKRAQLAEAAAKADQRGYETVTPVMEMGLPFMPSTSNAGYFKWPTLPELFPTSFPGVKTSRDDFLVDVDKGRLLTRLKIYFDPMVSHDDLRREYPGLMTDTARYKAEQIRDTLRKRGFLEKNVVRYCYRPFDSRWLYWEPETKLLDEKRDELMALQESRNLYLTSRQKRERFFEGSPFYVTPNLIDWHLTRPGSICFPLRMCTTHDGDLFGDLRKHRTPFNLSELAADHLLKVGIRRADLAERGDVLWYHALAVGHSARYLAENESALYQDFPRIPLPVSKKSLEASAELGRALAGLLDPEAAVKGVTVGAIRSELKLAGVIARDGGGTLNPDAGDLAVTAGWGHAGQNGVTMPGKGKTVERAYTPAERSAIEDGAKALGLKADDVMRLLGETTFDVYLNGVAYWRNIPARVWDYTLGGYQVIKKWLSYREKPLLGRDLTLDEAREVMNIARRITAIRMMESALDENFTGVGK